MFRFFSILVLMLFIISSCQGRYHIYFLLLHRCAAHSPPTRPGLDSVMENSYSYFSTETCDVGTLNNLMYPKDMLKLMGKKIIKLLNPYKPQNAASDQVLHSFQTEVSFKILIKMKNIYDHLRLATICSAPDTS